MPSVLKVTAEGLEVKCTGARELPSGWTQETAGSLWEPFEEIGGTKVTITERGCGKTFTVSAPGHGDPSDLANWDVKTNSSGQVIEEHKDVECPFCGRPTFVVREG